VAQSGLATIRITGIETKLARVDVLPLGRSPGDLEFISQALYSRQGSGSVIGRADIVCTFLGGTKRSCSATYLLPRGRIVTDGVIADRLVYEHAITGGTELYDNARGTLMVTTTGRRPRRQVLFFRLVDLTASQPVSPPASQRESAALLPPTPTTAPNADRHQPQHEQAGKKAGMPRPADRARRQRNGRQSH
jgi:hypothetical protein